MLIIIFSLWPKSATHTLTHHRSVAETSTWQNTQNKKKLKKHRQPFPPAEFLVFWIVSHILALYFFRVCFFASIVLACVFEFTVQHTTQTSVPLAGFEPATPARQWPPIVTSDLTASRINNYNSLLSTYLHYNVAEISMWLFSEKNRMFWKQFFGPSQKCNHNQCVMQANPLKLS
jgi:hypothetical protein